MHRTPVNRRFRRQWRRPCPQWASRSAQCLPPRCPTSGTFAKDTASTARQVRIAYQAPPGVDTAEPKPAAIAPMRATNPLDGRKVDQIQPIWRTKLSPPSGNGNVQQAKYAIPGKHIPTRVSTPAVFGWHIRSTDRVRYVARHIVCGSAANTGLCGGWPVTAIPTATVGRGDFRENVLAPPAPLPRPFATLQT
jgi:hypothetical protein